MKKGPSPDASKATVAAPRMNNIFTWKNINYAALAMEEVMGCLKYKPRDIGRLIDPQLTQQQYVLYIIDLC